MGSALETGRALLSRYLDRGSLSPRDAAEATALLAEGAPRNFPTHAGSPLQTALYLVRVALIAVQLLAAGDSLAAERQLVSALLSGRQEVSAAEPFDGLLFLVGARVAHELGDAETAERMAAGAHAVATRRAHAADTVRDLLGMPPGDEVPPNS